MASITEPRDQWRGYEETIQRFEEAWKRGDRPTLDDFLPAEPHGRWTLLVELVHTDLEFRLKAGEPARAEDYLIRFPDLAADRAATLELIAYEYELRCRTEPDLDRAEYQARFPHYDAEMLAFDVARSVGRADTPPRAGEPAADSTLRPAGPQSEAPPSGLGKYELLSIVGRGAFGVVYRARDMELNRVVAVKVPRPETLLAPADADRFLREAQSAARLQHPAIVTLLEAGRDGDTCFLVYEFVEGRTLKEQLERAPLGFRETADLMAIIAEALDHAHQHGVVHRDLKPSNILLDAAGRPHVLDFGLAKLQTPDRSLTQEGELLGTPAYMAPEQARGQAQEVDGRCDVYSLGVVLYELLTGIRPFQGSPQMLLRQVLEAEPRPPRRLNEAAPRDLETICLKCLQKEPARRYVTAAELAADLRRFLEGKPIHARPVGAVERLRKWVRRRPAVAALIVVCAVSAASLLAGGVRYVRHEEQLARTAEANALTSRRHQYAAEVSLAYEAWNQSRPEQARDLLERQRPAPGQPDLREFAWYHLWGLCNRDLVLRGHAGPVFCAAFTPDGKTLVSASMDRTIKLWDTATWTERATLHGHPKMVRALAITPDSRTLASGGMDGTLKLWDLETGKERASLSAGGSLFHLTFSPDGKTLAGSGHSKRIRLWNVAELRELPPLDAALAKPVETPTVTYGVAFSPDGRTLAAAYWGDFTIKLWDMSTRQVRRTLGPYKGPAASPVFSRDGRTLAAGVGDVLAVWDAATGRELMLLMRQGSVVRGVALAPDGRTLASAGADGAAKLWDLTTGKEKAVLKGHSGSLECVRYSPDGSIVATASTDRTIGLWDANGRRLRRPGAIAVAEPMTFPIVTYSNCLQFLSDSRTLAIAAGRLHLRDTITGQEVTPPSQPVPEWARLGLLPDGHTLALLPGDGSVWLWNTITGQTTGPFEGGKRFPEYAWAVSPDGRTLASGGGEPGAPSEVILWDVAGRRRRASLPGHSDMVRALAFSPDSRILASASADETVKLWDVATEREVRTLTEHNGPVYAAAFSPDDRTLATGGADQAVRLWDVPTYRERAVLRGHRGIILCLAFTPDGKTLASAGHDRDIKLWDPVIGRELATLTGHTNRIFSIAFAPDGKKLASGSWDLHVRVWPAAPDGE